jgi:hypothetical protein
LGLHLRGNILGYEQADTDKKLMVTGGKDVFEVHEMFDTIDFHQKHLLPFYDLHLKQSGIAYAEERRKAYKSRHEKDRKVLYSAGYYADKILW